MSFIPAYIKDPDYYQDLTCSRTYSNCNISLAYVCLDKKLTGKYDKVVSRTAVFKSDSTVKTYFVEPSRAFCIWRYLFRDTLLRIFQNLDRFVDRLLDFLKVPSGSPSLSAASSSCRTSGSSRRRQQQQRTDGLCSLSLSLAHAQLLALLTDEEPVCTVGLCRLASCLERRPRGSE